MTFNLMNTSNNLSTFANVKKGEGFFFAGGYYIKIAYDRAIRVGLTKNQPPVDEEGPLFEESFSFDDPVDKIYHNVSVAME